MNLQLTNQVDYAVRAMAYLAWIEQDKWIPSNVIAEKMLISRMFLSRINMLLAHAGLIYTQRGAKGGIMLAKPASEISLYEIIVAIEGPVYIHKCLASPDHCDFPLHEHLRTYWQTTQNYIDHRLKSTTLAELINQA